MLDDDISDVGTVGIPILVQTMYGIEHQMIHGYGAILASQCLQK